jgi:hypothetical protein
VRGGANAGVVGAVAVVIAVAGCGGSTSQGQGGPHSLAEARVELRRTVDPKLAKLGATARQTACIDHNIDTMTAGQFAHRLTEGRIVGPGAPRETPKSVAGTLGKGCF